MSRRWTRWAPPIELSAADLTTLIRPAFPGAAVGRFGLLKGGHANTNICVELEGERQPVLVRLFQRDPTQARKAFALSTRLSVAGLPVPRFRHFAARNALTGHAYAVIDWIDGEPLGTIGARLDRSALASLGRSIGAVLAGIHRVSTFDRFGLLDGSLGIAAPVSLSRDGLLAYLNECLVARPGGARLGSELTEGVLRFAEAESRLLDRWHGSPCLVHGDFGRSNLLVRSDGSAPSVAAVVDWESAFSGTPFVDLGNLLRPPLGESADFTAGIEAGYRAASGDLPGEWRRMSRLVDLFAWAGFLSHAHSSPALIKEARAAVQRTIAEPARV